MSEFQDGTKRMHVESWHGDFHVIFSLAEGLTKLGVKSIQAIQVSSAIGSAIHEGGIVLDILISIPFGVGCKESVFVDAFANIGSSQLGFECKCDWNLVLSHPLIVWASKATTSSCHSENTFMVNFKEMCTAELVLRRFACEAE